MRLLLFISLFCFLDPVSGQEEKQPLKDLFNEYHLSVNHGIGKGFFGGGLGANHVFHPEKIVSFRTGLDFQFFHAWGGSEDPSHYTSAYNIHYSYADLTVPLVLRVNIKWVFVELGGTIGAGIYGQRKATVISYSDYQAPVESISKTSWNPGLSAGLVFGIGARIPLNEKLELLVRPDLGGSSYFQQEFLNLYARLCIGIHLK